MTPTGHPSSSTRRPYASTQRRTGPVRDEPTGALDVQTGKIVLEVIERVNRELGTTTAVNTHNAAIAAMADRLLSLAEGRFVSDRRNASRASPAEIQW
jgi:putative ABC transport system ATP-binding protein